MLNETKKIDFYLEILNSNTNQQFLKRFKFSTVVNI